MAISAGRAELPIVPTLAKTFSRDLVTKLAGPAVKSANKTGTEAGRTFGRRFVGQAGQSAARDGERHGRRFGTSFSAGIRTGIGPVRGMMRGFGPALVGAFGATALIGAIKDVTDEARDAAAVGRITEARLKSTGGVANVTAGQVAGLAERISNVVGVDDDLIQSGENLMLTFSGVRNEVGAGNNIFDRATRLAVDLAAGMNEGKVSAGGLKTANIQLGKALEDPIRGITALRRSGVSFTAQQREQITTLVESGHTLEAQKVILKAVGQQFGGTAAAGADAGTRLGVVFGNVKEIIGAALLPVLNSVSNWISVTLPRVVTGAKVTLQTLKGWWDDNKTSVQALASILTDTFVPAVTGSNTQVHTFTDTLKNLKAFLTDVTIFILKGTLAWLALEHVTIGLISTYGSFLTAGGHVVNLMDKLSGGTGHAGDQFVHFGQQIKDQARVELQGVRTDAIRAQTAIDALKSKAIHITATTSLQFTKSFSKKDWLDAKLAAGAGRMATGGLVRGPGGPTADKVPIWASAGEAVVPTRLVPAVAPFLAANNVPGFKRGGLLAGELAQTGTAHTGVGKMMDRWGTLIEAAGVKDLMAMGGSPAIKAFIKSVDPLPYIWGAAGPGGYDCSGLVSAVYGKHTGRGGGHGQRYFTTGSISTAVPGLKSGLGGVLQIGVTAGTGHMAGRYGGLGFEAESTRTGIKIGAAASRPEGFARRYHMARGGPVDPNMLARMGLDVGGDPDRLRINGKVFDRGGTLAPGFNLVANRTGRDEPLVPAGGGKVVVNVTVNGAVGNTRDIARALVPEIRQGLKDAQRHSGVPKREQVR